MRLQSILSRSPLLLTLLLFGCGDGSNSHGNGSNSNGDATTYDDCNLPPQDIVVNTTESGVEFVRTPDACFEALDGYDYPPNYVTVDGLRMHYVDAGPADGEVILMLHG